MTSSELPTGVGIFTAEVAPPSWLLTGERFKSWYQKVAKSRETARNAGYSKVLTDTAGHSEIASDLA